MGLGEILAGHTGGVPNMAIVGAGGVGLAAIAYLRSRNTTPAATGPLTLQPASDLGFGGGSLIGGALGTGSDPGTGSGSGSGGVQNGPGVGGVVPPQGSAGGYPAGDTNPSLWTNGVDLGQALKNSGYVLGPALGGGIYAASDPSGNNRGIYDSTPGFGSPWGEFISGGGDDTSLIYGGEQYNETPKGWILGPSTPIVAAANGISGIPGLYNSGNVNGWQSPSVNPGGNNGSTPNWDPTGSGNYNGSSPSSAGVPNGGAGYATGVVTNNPPATSTPSSGGLNQPQYNSNLRLAA